MFAIWMNGPFLIEVQRSVYSNKVMEAKIQRYERYYHSREWELEPWQPQDKKQFPNILLITEHTYTINSNLRIIQELSIEAFIEKVQAHSKTPSRS
ncbi:hypothetical protein GCM10007140_32470 [Priestia taiwanensis]|uniref:Uncharacterized protein n=2 Tax=Priestia taiwanensis TaxID=1347902 RepID=A0A917ESE2_9BACI|nr:hypothetical protein GCM10007140_32470 [Priestia taiwanensis]